MRCWGKSKALGRRLWNWDNDAINKQLDYKVDYIVVYKLIIHCIFGIGLTSFDLLIAT